MAEAKTMHRLCGALAEGKAQVTRGSRQLLEVLLQQAKARTTNLNFKEVVPITPLRRWLLLGGVATLGTLAITAVTLRQASSCCNEFFCSMSPSDQDPRHRHHS